MAKRKLSVAASEIEFPSFGDKAHIRQVVNANAPRFRGLMCRQFCKQFETRQCPDQGLRKCKGELCEDFVPRELEPVRLASLIHELSELVI